MTLLLVSVLVVMGIGLYVLAPHPPPTPRRVGDLGDLETYISQLTASGNPPGLTVVVVGSGRVVYGRSFGFADAPRGRRTTLDTVYHWWSLTKIPTAMAVIQLREQGLLDLEDTVADLLPWFQVEYPSRSSPAISVRDLLQHTSGLRDTMPGMIGWVHYDDTVRDQTELLRGRLPQFSKLRFAPGQRAMYSNLNYMVLGAIIEAVTGQTYEEYVTDNILEPLGMTQTGFVFSPAMAEHEAAGTLPLVHIYTPLLPALLDTHALIRERQGNLLWLNRVYVDATPSTGLIGPAPDLARLMRAYLDGGALDGKRILATESVRMMTEAAPLDGHGLGWSVGECQGLRFLEHAGGGPGFGSIMRLYPERGLGMAILANGTDLDRHRLMTLLTNVDWSSE